MSLSRPQHRSSVPLDKVWGIKSAARISIGQSNEGIHLLKMKFLSLLAVFLILGCSSFSQGAAVAKPTGQPGCQTAEEVAVIYYPHFYLKSSYWICSAQGVPATLGQCPVATAYLDSAKACVAWPLWTWSPTVQPPSQPEIAA